MAPKDEDESDDSRAARRFRAFLTAVVRVPKREIDEQEAKREKKRDTDKVRAPVRQRA